MSVLLLWFFLGLSVHIFTENNGFGLTKDGRILKEAIERAGHQAVVYEAHAEAPPADVNIFFETLESKQFCKAKRNWFIPNPDWYRDPIEMLQSVDLILCKTKEAERIFSYYNVPTYYLGFTSEDCYRTFPKNYSRSFHLGGNSYAKGTEEILSCWASNSVLPHLMILRNVQPKVMIPPHVSWVTTYLPENMLRQVQNGYGIHLCPSRTEGFGHYIVEGMSTEAVVITTDAPPMNEFIRDERCLVPYCTTSTFKLATCYHVDPESLEKALLKILNLPKNEKEAIGKRNRICYLQMQQAFHDRLKILLDSVVLP